MPDRRRHRGQHPDDGRLFAPAVHGVLRTAAKEYAWLLTRGYAPNSTLKLVGDQHGLSARQRQALRRSACSDQARKARAAKAVTLGEVGGRAIAIDGYNLLITVESALSGGFIFIGQDGCYRDLAGIHGTYRHVEETVPAIQTITEFLDQLQISHIDWYLDRPVSNSGRLKALMGDVLAAKKPHARAQTNWNIELLDSPDKTLTSYPGPIATCDSAILDRCSQWVNLAAEIIAARLPNALKVDLRT